MRYCLPGLTKVGSRKLKTLSHLRVRPMSCRPRLKCLVATIFQMLYGFDQRVSSPLS